MKRLLHSALFARSLARKGLAVKALTFSCVDSTNLCARRLFASGVRVPTVILASRQTVGRGRLGRSFYSPKSGFYFSLLYPLKEADLSAFVPLTAAVSVAVHRAVKKRCGISLGLKWVNDLQKEGKKVCGILCESVREGNDTAVIIGIGINLRPMEFPPELSSVATTLGDEKTSKETLACAILEELMPMLQTPLERAWLSDYKANSVLLGKQITCIRGDERFEATALEFDDNAGLSVRLSDGSVTTLASGEVTVRLTESFETAL